MAQESDGSADAFFLFGKCAAEFGVKSADGDPVLHPEGYYTVNDLQ